MHIVMAIVLFGIAGCCWIVGYYAAPVFRATGFTTATRWAVSFFLTAMGSYMAWIGYLFSRDMLSGVNLEWPIVLIRVIALVSAMVIAFQSWRVGRALREQEEHG
jgi:hypothetical protein